MLDVLFQATLSWILKKKRDSDKEVETIKLE